MRCRRVIQELSPAARPLSPSGRTETVFRQAKPIPLTDQIRIERGAIYDVLDRMRATIAEAG